MKHLFIYILLLAATFFAPIHAEAAFVVKKQVVVQKTQNHAIANAIQVAYPDNNSASGTFIRMMQNGTVGVLAALFGILGFFMPIFALGAIVFGYLGIGANKIRRNRGLAIFGLVLGLVALIVSAAGGFAPLSIF